MEITFEEFTKIEIKIGKIISAEAVEGSTKLLKLRIEFGKMDSGSTAGMTEVRTIVSGVAKQYLSEQLIGKQVPVVMNLAPRILKGIESQGMVLFAIGEGPIMLNPEKEIPNGSAVQ